MEPTSKPHMPGTQFSSFFSLVLLFTLHTNNKPRWLALCWALGAGPAWPEWLQDQDLCESRTCWLDVLALSHFDMITSYKWFFSPFIRRKSVKNWLNIWPNLKWKKNIFSIELSVLWEVCFVRSDQTVCPELGARQLREAWLLFKGLVGSQQPEPLGSELISLVKQPAHTQLHVLTGTFV